MQKVGGHLIMAVAETQDNESGEAKLKRVWVVFTSLIRRGEIGGRH